ncbi:MAG: hypothetical protein H5T86_16955 [Armatimonadetes bacterium]|nr:hypothetical protein [Armatimonadota bacterium]
MKTFQPHQLRQRAHRRADAILVRRCRDGDPEALEILAYRLSASLWPAVSDRPDAHEACQRGWDAVLRALSAWHPHSLAALERLALKAVGGAHAGETTRPPVEVVQAMVQRAAMVTTQLAEASKRRHFWRLQGYALIAALALGSVVMLAGYGTMNRLGRVSPAVLSELQFRVRHPGLSTELRDICWDLPAAGDRPEHAKILESAALALDEIASINPRQAEQLRYVVWRIAAGALPDKLREIADDVPTWKKATVLDAALVLEEVAAWFGAL